MAQPLYALIDRAAAGRLRRNSTLDNADFTWWEQKTLNMHRAVVLWTPRNLDSIDRLREAVRDEQRRRAPSSWWRGMGFGAVVAVPSLTLSPDELALLIDVRKNGTGTWQSAVLAATEARAAVGVHTWAEGYLTPVYRALLGGLEKAGYAVCRTKREKDGLMRVLTGAANLAVTVRSLGLKRTVLAEFDDER